MAIGEPGGLFALLRDGEDSVQRVPLDEDARSQATSILKVAANELLSPNLERIVFDGRCRPDTDEILVAPDFSLPASVVAALAEPLACEPVLLARGEPLPRIRAFFTGGRDGNWVAFQAFRPNQFLVRKGLSLLFRQGIFSALETPGINIRDDVDLCFEDGQLVFRSFQVARSILDLSGYFQEATEQELTAFAESVRFNDRQRFLRNADSHIRRRVALIRYNGILERYAAPAIVESARSHNIPLGLREVDGAEMLLLPDDKRELKAALKFLDEDYYKGPITGKPYVSNSKSLRR